MENLIVTQSEFDDILSVFQERGIELLYSVQDGEVRTFYHFDEVEAILWAIQVVQPFQGARIPCIWTPTEGNIDCAA